MHSAASCEATFYSTLLYSMRDYFITLVDMHHLTVVFLFDKSNFANKIFRVFGHFFYDASWQATIEAIGFCHSASKNRPCRKYTPVRKTAPFQKYDARADEAMLADAHWRTALSRSAQIDRMGEDLRSPAGYRREIINDDGISAIDQVSMRDSGMLPNNQAGISSDFFLKMPRRSCRNCGHPVQIAQTRACAEFETAKVLDQCQMANNRPRSHLKAIDENNGAADMGRHVDLIAEYSRQQPSPDPPGKQPEQHLQPNNH